MKRSESIGKLAEALCRAQSEFSPAPYDAKNPHFNSKYASLASIIDATKPMYKHGLSVSQSLEFLEGRVSVTTLLLHTSGEWIESTLSMKPRSDTPQDSGSAATYGRRYGLSAMLGICSDDDDDGNAATGPQKQTKQTTGKPATASTKQEPAKTAADTSKQASEKPATENPATGKAIRFFRCMGHTCGHVVSDYEPPAKCPKCPCICLREFLTLQDAKNYSGDSQTTEQAQKQDAAPATTSTSTQPAENGKAIADQLNKIIALCKAKGAETREAVLSKLSGIVGREIKSTTNLSSDERAKCLEVLK